MLTRFRLISFGLAFARAAAFAAEMPVSAGIESRIIRLPGPPAVLGAPARSPEPVLPEAARKAPAPPAHDVSKRAPSKDPGRVAAATKPRFPAEFARDSAAFLQQKVGRWMESDCRALLGRAVGLRPAFGEGGLRTGDIVAFADPTGRYLRLEVEVEKPSGRIRTVFAYPRRMLWSECLRLWGPGAMAANARKGRIFYSYAERRVDVLVEPSGKVVSLGLY